MDLETVTGSFRHDLRRGEGERERTRMAESEGEVVFSSLQEELEYWKEKALEYRQRYCP